MVDYRWVDINSTGLRKAICMVAEMFHNGEEPTYEEIGVILHKTTQRSGLKNAPIMLESVKEMGKVYESSLRRFSEIAKKNGATIAKYEYCAELNCARFGDDGMYIGISNSIPTARDFESLSNCRHNTLLTVLNLCDGVIYKKPVMA